MKPYLFQESGRWHIQCWPYVYRVKTFAQACEVARRIIGPDSHMPEFLWLRTRAW